MPEHSDKSSFGQREFEVFVQVTRHPGKISEINKHKAAKRNGQAPESWRADEQENNFCKARPTDFWKSRRRKKLDMKADSE
jgi:hypothetical protein